MDENLGDGCDGVMEAFISSVPYPEIKTWKTPVRQIVWSLLACTKMERD